MMKYYFHQAAQKEFQKAIDYYDSERLGLGSEFAEEVYLTILRILDFPHAWSKMSVRSRRCLVNRFPYGVIYRVLGDEIHIIAVAHLHRRPDYWMKRR